MTVGSRKLVEGLHRKPLHTTLCVEYNNVILSVFLKHLTACKPGISSGLQEGCS
jgi:hypothetical protein